MAMTDRSKKASESLSDDQVRDKLIPSLAVALRESAGSKAQNHD
jgi:hypothetical protein